MNIDERLDKLTERHEALAQTVKIIAGMQRDNDARFEERFAWNEKRMAEIMEAINSLARIAEIHERPLDDMEGQH